MRNVKAALEKSQNLGKPISPEVIVIANNMEEPGRLADLTASNLDLKVEGAQEILEALDPVERLRRVHELMTKELEVLDDAAGDLLPGQGGDGPQPARVLPAPAAEGDPVGARRGQRARRGDRAARARRRTKAKMPKPVLEEVERQLKKLERMHPDAAETATLRNWLDWMVTLPWGKATKDNLDLERGPADPRRGPLRPREGQGAHRRVPRGAQAQGEDEGAAPLLRRARPASARRASAAPSRARSAASSCGSRSAA